MFGRNLRCQPRHSWVSSGGQHLTTSQRRGRLFQLKNSRKTTFHVKIRSCFNWPNFLCDSVEITEPRTHHASRHSAAGRAVIEHSAVGHIDSVRDVLVWREARSSQPGTATTSGLVRSLSKRIKKSKGGTYKPLSMALCLEVEITHNSAQLVTVVLEWSCPNTWLHCCQTGFRHF